MLGDWGMAMGCDATGHEGAGVVVSIGDSVEGWKIGDRAGIKPVMDVCHECEYCRNGLETHCPKEILTGVTVNGSYAQWVRGMLARRERTGNTDTFIFCSLRSL
jgi:propanol-preferring alcohol dehydrogenase